MQKLRECVMPVVLVATAIAVILLIVGLVRSNHDAEVRRWAADHGYEVVSIERVWGLGDNDSPFYRRKNDDLCRVVLSRHGRDRTSFFRWFWNMEQAWKEGED